MGEIMSNGRSIGILFAAAVTAASVGCSREQPAQVAESQTQSPVIATNAPATLNGCLRAGEAADTFVLTTSGLQAATYHLVPDEGIDLREHVGREIQVDGVIRTQQQTTATASSPADPNAVGTAGQPAVATRTELDVNRFEVSSVKSVGQGCK
jgi:hypothetical protein